MPGPTTARLPKPRAADEFEDIATDVLRIYWGDPNAQRFGRNGQKQYGVDILCQPPVLDGDWAGAQCKNGESLPFSDVVADLDLAARFSPPLRQFYILTSADRDATVQHRLAKVEAEKSYPFKVFVLFWDDIVGILAGVPALVEKYWSAFTVSGLARDRTRTHRDYLHALGAFCRTADQAAGPDGRASTSFHVPQEFSDDDRDLRTTAGCDTVFGPEGKMTRVAVLGGPGSGKSTFLRNIAVHAWSAPERVGLRQPHLPLLVPLRSLPEGRGDLAETLARTIHNDGLLPFSFPPDYALDWQARTGVPWLLLLDGLDEIPSLRRQRVLDWISTALSAMESTWRDAKVVITSRPVEFAEAQLDPGRFHRFRLLPFSSARVKEYVEQRCGETSPELIRQLSQLRIGDIHATPLVLRIATNVFVRTGHLPSRRSGLYRAFVAGLFADAMERGLEQDLDRRLARQAENITEDVALALTRDRVEPSESAISSIVSRVLQQALGLSEEEAEVESVTLVRCVAERSGVFSLAGGRCAFLHPTLATYMAARRIVRGARTTEEQLTEAILSVWDHEAGDLATWTMAVASDVNLGVEGAIVRKLAEAGATADAMAMVRLGEALAVESIPVSDTTRASVAGSMLNAVQARSGQPETRRRIAELLELFDRDSLAVAAWSELAGDLSASPPLRMRSAEALFRLGNASSIRSLGNDESTFWQTRIRAGEVLFGMGHAALGREVMTRLAENPAVYGEIREDAARNLLRWGALEAARRAFMCLADDRTVHTWMKSNAITALKDLGCGDDLARLGEDATVHSAIRHGAIAALAEMREVALLRRVLHSKPRDYWTRKYLAQALTAVDEQEGAVDLWSLIASEPGAGADVRHEAAGVLVKLGAIESAADALLLVLDDRRGQFGIRVDSAQQLARMRPDDRTMAAMCAVADDPGEDGWLRVRVAEALPKLGREHQLRKLANDQRLPERARAYVAKELARTR